MAAVLAWWGARWDSIGRNRIARSGQDPIGRVAADREAGADYAGHAESTYQDTKSRNFLNLGTALNFPIKKLKIFSGGVHI